MDDLDEKAIGLMVEIRDNPIVKEMGGTLQAALKDLLEELTLCLRNKTEKCKRAHEGYTIWKARCLNYGHIIMDLRRRKAAADREYLQLWFE